MSPSTKPDSHTPPLGHKALTPLYDIVIATLTREGAWRRKFVRVIAPELSDRIVDIGSGTGSLAIALNEALPGVTYVGVDPDEEAARRARKKTARLGPHVRFEIGYFSADSSHFDKPPNKIVSSLVLHQVPVDEKERIIRDIYRTLPAGGKVCIADYGYQKPGLMRLLFRITVQALDGVEDTQPNAHGIIPKLLKQSGFSHVSEVSRIPTLTGTISIYSGEKL